MMVAIAFLVIAVLGLMAVQAFTLKSQQKSTARFRASQKAIAVMADIEVALAADLDTVVTVARQPLPVAYNPEGHPEFEYEISEWLVGPPTDRLKEVELVLHWEDEQGAQSFQCGSRFTE